MDCIIYINPYWENVLVEGLKEKMFLTIFFAETSQYFAGLTK